VRRPVPVLLIALISVSAACEDGSDILVIDESGSVYLVSTNADGGEGSLRSALEGANSDPLVNTVQIQAGVGPIALGSSLTYTGAQGLRILGNGVVIDGSGCGCDVLVSTGGGNLDLFDMTVSGGDTGLKVSVPGSRTGTVEIRLVGVAVEENGLHGVYLDDRTSSSGASLSLELVSSSVQNNGFAQGVSDYDGVRVDEGGPGDISFVARDSDARDNAGDGVELNEAGTGDVFVDVRDSSFDNNGEQPQVIDLPEDGFNVLESGSGSIDVRIVSSTMSGNHASGIALGESGDGDVRGTLTGVEASENLSRNISVDEDVDAEGGNIPGAGGISLAFSEVTAKMSGLDGARMREMGAGDLSVQLVDSDFSDNDGDGLNVSQGSTGKGTLSLVRVTTAGNGDSPVTTEGTFVTEGDDQTTTVLVRNNQDAGFGSLRAALEVANTDEGISQILFETGMLPISLESTLEFVGSQDLQIIGEGAWINAENCDCEALLISGPGHVAIQGVSIEDAAEDGLRVIGGGDLSLRNLVLRNMEGNGLFVDVLEDAEGTVSIMLDQVLIENNGLHGVLIDDLAPAFGPGTGASSAAGIRLDITGSTIRQNGYRQDVTDRDGVRVDEGGLGDIGLFISSSVIQNNAGDGVELNEEGLGAVEAAVQESQLDTNGSQPQNTDEPEDGIDIQEVGPGGVRVQMRESFVRGNAARGFGLEEEGSGDVRVTLEEVTVTGNGEENITLTEDRGAQNDPEAGGGSLWLSFTQVTATGAGADGVYLAEYGPGDFTGQLVDSAVRNNGGNGVQALQAGAGSGQIQLVRVVLSPNVGEDLVTEGVGVAVIPAG